MPRGFIGQITDRLIPEGLLSVGIISIGYFCPLLVRRGQALAHTETVLTAGMWLVGGTYHFCWLHESLRRRAPAGAPWQWQECTPAMAAGLTNHRWTMRER